ncbi:MAG: ATP synthase F0F1 subunit gamma [Sulfuricurvum sp. PC08-66]|nr:MAG: ATP synthase F0F1 subunit gamma [Sulfuricurvum sp. PC08-66]
MANLKEIQRKIKSVSGTQKTTRAMKLVSTAKLRRTEELAKRSKVYANKLNMLLSDIANKIQHYKIGGLGEHKTFSLNDTPEVVDVIFVTADKGLCGGFNVQTIKAVKRLLATYKNDKVKVRLKAIGKKGIEYFRYNGLELIDESVGLSSAPDYKKAADFIRSSVEDFMKGKTDRVVIVHNGYVNMISQEMRIDQVLPVDVTMVPFDTAKATLLEIEAQDEEKMLEELVAKYVEYNMYYALIDSLAAEHSARMQAMDAATNNAKEMVKSLKVKFNKARQESITTELIEIISGVESMK